MEGELAICTHDAVHSYKFGHGTLLSSPLAAPDIGSRPPPMPRLAASRPLLLPLSLTYSLSFPILPRPLAPPTACVPYPCPAVLHLGIETTVLARLESRPAPWCRLVYGLSPLALVVSPRVVEGRVLVCQSGTFGSWVSSRVASPLPGDGDGAPPFFESLLYLRLCSVAAPVR